MSPLKNTYSTLSSGYKTNQCNYVNYVPCTPGSTVHIPPISSTSYNKFNTK